MLTKNQKRTYLYPPGAGLTISMPVSETESGESSKGSGKFRLAGPPIRQCNFSISLGRAFLLSAFQPEIFQVLSH